MKRLDPLHYEALRARVAETEMNTLVAQQVLLGYVTGQVYTDVPGAHAGAHAGAPGEAPDSGPQADASVIKYERINFTFDQRRYDELRRPTLPPGYEPVWSCHGGNHGSRKLAGRLGFREALGIPYYRLPAREIHNGS